MSKKPELPERLPSFGLIQYDNPSEHVKMLNRMIGRINCLIDHAKWPEEQLPKVKPIGKCGAECDVKEQIARSKPRGWIGVPFTKCLKCADAKRPKPQDPAKPCFAHNDPHCKVPGCPTDDPDRWAEKCCMTCGYGKDSALCSTCGKHMNWIAKPREPNGVGLKSILHPGVLEDVEVELPKGCHNCAEGPHSECRVSRKCLASMDTRGHLYKPKPEGRVYCCETFRLFSGDNDVHWQGCQCFLRVGKWQTHLAFCPFCGRKL